MSEQFDARSRLVICEGPSDAAFVRALAKFHTISNCGVREARDPRQMGRSGGGFDFIAPTLASFVGMPHFENVHDVLLLADNDDNPADRFRALVSQIEDQRSLNPDFRRMFDAPLAELQTVRGEKSLTVMMMPSVGQAGNVETLIYQAASIGHQQNAACVEQFALSSGAASWPPGKRDKMRLRSLFACTHRDRPDIALGHVWTNRADYLVPLGDPSFNELVRVVRDFPF